MTQNSSALLLAAAAALAFPLWAQTNAEKAAANVAHLHEAWGEKTSTPDTSLTIKEASRSGKTISFRIYATDLPADSVFTLVAWPLTQRGPSEILEGVTFNAMGLGVCAGRPGTCGIPDKPDDPLEIPLEPAPGEPIRLGLISPDGAIKVYAKFVAIPIRGEDRGCRVEGILLTPGAEIIIIEGNGFAAGSEIVIETDSEGERHEAKGTADSGGQYASPLLPYKKGLDNGTVKVTLKSASCSPAVSVPWGYGAQ